MVYIGLWMQLFDVDSSPNHDSDFLEPDETTHQFPTINYNCVLAKFVQCGTYFLDIESNKLHFFLKIQILKKLFYITLIIFQNLVQTFHLHVILNKGS